MHTRPMHTRPHAHMHTCTCTCPRRRLVAARYGRDATDELLRSRTMMVPGGHCCFFGDVPELAHKYTQYLLSVGFLTR